MTERDEGLGTLIRELVVPEHAPDFFDRLNAALAEAGIEMRRARRRRRSYSLVATAAVLVGTIVVSWIGLPGTGPGPVGPRVASAAEVQRRVAEAFARARTLEGTLQVEAAEPIFPTGERLTFATNAAGDYAYETDTGERAAFRAEPGELREMTSVGNGQFAGFIQTGLPPSWPFSKLDRELGSVVRAFLQEDTTAPVEEITYGGRPAWRLSLDVDPTRYSESPDHLDITVDRETGFPLLIEETRNGSFLRRRTLSDLKVNGELPPDRFTLEFPPAPTLVRLDRVDTGFRRVGLDGVQAAVGYAPLVPGEIPEGFEGPEVAVADETQPTGDEAMNPRSRDVLDVTYRRGLDRFVVTVYRTGPEPQAWTDPISGGEATVERPESVVLEGGFLSGERADVVIEPRTPPHLWLVTAEFVVTLSGDLSRDELVSVAESLAQRP